MKQQPTKQRLKLMQAFISMINTFDQEHKLTESDLQKVIQLIQSMVIEFIMAVNNSNKKIRKLSEDAFI